jgi:AcrR family transcriptional regulator
METQDGAALWPDDTALPPGVAAAWGLRERPGKGPKPGLSRERVVDAAVRVAAAEGLAAVSMTRVAKELGAGPMSLYRHVKNKDELLALMIDMAMGPTRPDPSGEGWRADLAQWAWSFRTTLGRNLWAVDVPLRGLPVLPNEVGWTEAALSALTGTRLSAAEKLSVLLLVSTYVRSQAQMNAQIAAAFAASGSSPDELMAGYSRLLAALAGAGRFPALAEVVATGVLERADDPDDEFRFGLERILDGIEALVRSRDAGTTTC